MKKTIQVIAHKWLIMWHLNGPLLSTIVAGENTTECWSTKSFSISLQI